MRSRVRIHRGFGGSRISRSTQAGVPQGDWDRYPAKPIFLKYYVLIVADSTTVAVIL